jgi:glycosyltransferase involved in cell wall biosynthesis
MLESSVSTLHVMREPAADCRSVLMVGTDLDGMGGVRSVVRGYLDGGLFQRYPCVYVASHRAGSTWVKITTALKAWLRVAVLLRRLDAPLVHVQTASRGSFWRKFVVCLLARAAGRPYIVHLHGGGFTRFYQDESGSLGRRLIRSTLAHAALVIALSEEWRQQLLRICPTAKIEVLHNAVVIPDIHAPRPQESEPVPAGDSLASRSVGGPMGQPTLLFLGHLLRDKGVYDLVRAFALIAPKFPRARLVLGGVGDIEAVRQLAAQLEIPRRVSCPGWLDAERKAAAFASSVVFLLPSYAEGMPMALLEAMSWGLPVIATPVGGIPQLVEHEVSGLLIAPGDIKDCAAQMERLLTDPSLRERLGSAARERIAADFSIGDALDRLSAIYQRFGLEPRAAVAGETA